MNSAPDALLPAMIGDTIAVLLVTGLVAKAVGKKKDGFGRP